jgi:heme exporter protein B
VLEVRQQYAFYGVLLYVGATIFVLYMAVEHPDTPTWNGLFWIIQLFISINAVAKSFLQESRSRMLYYQSIVRPQHFILAKLLFNSVLMLVMSTLSFILFSLLMEYPVE